MGGFFSPSKTQEVSTSAASSGVFQPGTAGLGRFGHLALEGFDETLAALRSRAQAPASVTVPNVLPEYDPSTGLFAPVRGMFNEAFNQALNKFSGNYALRGFNNPNAIAALTGSAMQNVIPQFAQFVGPTAELRQSVAQNVALLPQQIQEQIQQQRFRQILEALGLVPGFAGTTSTASALGTGTGSGLGFELAKIITKGSFDVAAAGAGSAGAAGAAGAGCWIAQLLYGHSSWKVSLLREWLEARLSSTLIGHVFVPLYRHYGFAWADQAEHDATLRKFWQRLFDRFSFAALTDHRRILAVQ